MAYTLDIDPAARAQIRELPPAGTAALAEAFEVLSLVPERGKVEAGATLVGNTVTYEH